MKNTNQVQIPKFELEKVLFSWKAPTHAFRKKNREFWVKIVAVVSLLGFIFFIAEGIMPVILLVSVLFLFYVLSVTEPETIECSITNKGINISERKNLWELFKGFTFTSRAGVNFLVLNMFALPGKMELIMDEKDKSKIVSVLTKYIPEEELSTGRFDKVSEWVSNKIS